MSDRPRVTIGLPVYNGERFLAESIESVLGQTYRDLELVIADNASTDRSLEIAEEYAASDPRVRILRSDENRGAAWNYNRLLDEARGSLFRWHAHDDLFAPTLIDACVAALDADPGAVLAHSWTLFIDDDGTPVRTFEDDLGATADRPSERLDAVITNLTYCNAVFGLIRTEPLAASARIRSFPGSDVSLLYELSALGRFAVIDEPLYLRRPGNSVKGRSRSVIADWFQPGGPGSRFPGAWIYRSTMQQIASIDAPAAERLRLAAVMHRRWPREYLRRKKRRRERARRAEAA